MKTALTALALTLAASSVAALPITLLPPVLTFPEAQADVSTQNGPVGVITPQAK